MSERKAGWYWVKHFVTEWECQYWTGNEWDGIEPIKAGPRIPTPDEPWQTVPTDPSDAMIDAASMALDGSIGGYESGRAMTAYKAHITAAPKP